MRPALVYSAILPASLWTLVTARFHNSLVPEDPYAFPKYRVTFLNGHPVLNETAQRWIQQGLSGGELEFLDQPWGEDAQWRTPPVKSIDGTRQDEDTAAAQPEPPSYKLELMKMGPRDSYLCLIPPPPLDNTSAPVEEPTTDVTPVHSWSLLQPLAGSCLYHKQGWFTYAYCHNSHVRQFHELARPPNQRPGEYRPVEDTEWEAYTLGRAPPTPEPGADLTVAQEAAIAANVELARSAGSRYLVQRWSDGTYCEKIGRKREIEIQFHCSMTMTDTILFVKETQTCKYVLHIATPRLCGEPGFRSRRDAREEAYIRCREVVSPEQLARMDRTLPEADQPIKMPPRADKPVLAPAPPAANEQDKASEKDGKASKNEAIRRALEKLVSGGDLKAGEVTIIDDGDDEVIIEFLDLGDDDYEGQASLHELLRSAGLDIRTDPHPDDSDEDERREGHHEEHEAYVRDEL
ncbi:glucosidase II beta subunit-like protein-domain-containing protein [Phanerochaete sordida]|uniref:Protein OS-9 homolog n=1 Tax=Phanerochaete sordida TaxID=48140 RepID=A0A9P3G9L8_9APHY|nr:glucosidase II beta subunit-like protein-domain-containing protein [Phanerochaete sordida]